MAYIVTVVHNGVEVPLRGTVWAYSMDRAQRFETRDQATNALHNAKQFMRASVFKKAQIKEVE